MPKPRCQVAELLLAISEKNSVPNSLRLSTKCSWFWNQSSCMPLFVDGQWVALEASFSGSCIQDPTAQSQGQYMETFSPLECLCSLLLLCILERLLFSLYFKDSCDYMRPTCKIQNDLNFKISLLVALLTLANSFMVLYRLVLE